MSTASIATIEQIDVSGLAEFQLLNSLIDWDGRASERACLSEVISLAISAGFTLVKSVPLTLMTPGKCRLRRDDIKIEVIHSTTKSLAANVKAKTNRSGFATISKHNLCTVADIRALLYIALLPRRRGTRGALPPPDRFLPVRIVPEEHLAFRATVQVMRSTLNTCRVLWSGGINSLDWSISENQLSVPDAQPWFAVAAMRWTGRTVHFITNCDIWYRVWDSTVHTPDRFWRIAVAVEGADRDIPHLYELDQELVRAAVEQWFHEL